MKLRILIYSILSILLLAIALSMCDMSIQIIRLNLKHNQATLQTTVRLRFR